MKREDYIKEAVAVLVNDGMEYAAAKIVAGLAWNMLKWQYE